MKALFLKIKEICLKESNNGFFCIIGIVDELLECTKI